MCTSVQRRQKVLWRKEFASQETIVWIVCRAYAVLRSFNNLATIDRLPCHVQHLNRSLKLCKKRNFRETNGYLDFKLNISEFFISRSPLNLLTRIFLRNFVWILVLHLIIENPFVRRIVVPSIDICSNSNNCGSSADGRASSSYERRTITIATLNILLASLLLSTASLYGSNNDTLGGWHNVRSEEEGGTATCGQIYRAWKMFFLRVIPQNLFVIGVWR